MREVSSDHWRSSITTTTGPCWAAACRALATASNSRKRACSGRPSVVAASGATKGRPGTNLESSSKTAGPSHSDVARPARSWSSARTWLQGWSGTRSPSCDDPQTTAAPQPPTCRASSAAKAVFPMPGSPVTSRRRPRPPKASSAWESRSSMTPSRPTSPAGAPGRVQYGRRGEPRGFGAHAPPRPRLAEDRDLVGQDGGREHHDSPWAHPSMRRFA